jgi:hypothetical protein
MALPALVFPIGVTGLLGRLEILLRKLWNAGLKIREKISDLK